MSLSWEILVFEVDGQRHALPVAEVRELLPAATLTPVPGAAAGVEGVINLRGVVVPVVDVRQRFGLPSKPLAATDHFVVVMIQERLVVLHVDRALELVQLGPNALVQAEALGLHGVLSARMVQCADGLVVLHEARHFLTQGGADFLPAPSTAKEAQP